MKSKSHLFDMQSFVLGAMCTHVAPLLLVIVGMLAASSAFAVGGVSNVFEIADGNAMDENPPEPIDDWNTIVPGSTNEGGGVYTGPPFPSNPGFTANALISTFFDGDRGGDRFTGGSKDHQGISEWSWDNHNPPPGNDFINSYAAAYMNANNDLILVCGIDRYQTNGSFAIGCWFFQDEVGKVGMTGGTFAGYHADGDVLVTAEFGGQGIDEIHIFEWQCGAGLTPMQCDTTGSLAEVTPAGQTNFQCSEITLANVMACGETNLGLIEIPWEPGSTYKNSFQADGSKGGNYVGAGTFLEVIINASELFPGGASCFSAFMATSRSSATLNAELKEFETGGFNLCSVAATKVCAPDPTTGYCETSPTTSCSTDDDCSTGVHCITTNPYIAADGVTIVMDNVVNIDNPGVATIYDCQIKENATYNTGESGCAITAVNGVAVGPVAMTVGTYYDVPSNGGDYTGSIAAGGDIDVTVSCSTQRNPYPNQVDVRCASSDGGAKNVSSSGIDLNTTGDACAVTPTGNIDVSKMCVDVRLKPVGTIPGTPPGYLVVETIYSVTVENKGNELLENVVLTDVGTDGATNNLITLGDNVSLAPGASMSFTVADTPARPDQSASGICSLSTTSCTLDSDCATGETCVNRFDQVTATFADTASASATGAISGQTATDMQTLTPPCRVCPLPPCPANECQ